MSLNCPAATCQSCSRLYTGWGLVKREICECGGKLILHWPWEVIIGYVRAGNGRNDIIEFKKNDVTDNPLQGDSV